MPELPDVEIFKKYLDSTSLHQTIREVEVKDKRLLHRISPQGFRKILVGRKFRRIGRHGKYLFIRLDSGRFVYFHFGMTGQVKYFKRKENLPAYIRILFHFSNGFHLAYISKRMLGEIGTAGSVTEFIRKRRLGIDAMELEFEDFKHLINTKRGKVKSFLMNQEWLAGIGNIYADEILFQSRIHPEESMDRLDGKSIRIMFRQMHRVLRKAVASHADPGRLPHSYLIPQREKGGRCPRSHGKLKKIRVRGRATYFSPDCQKKAG
jgi:formamidopyrimidine-DNA glycosylase